MKIIFNDATEQAVQQVTASGDYLRILSLEDPAALRAAFEDPLKVKKMTVQERGQTIEEYEGYTDLYSIAWTPGGIYIVTMYRPEQTPEVQADIQAAAVLVAQMQAQELTDAQAITVKAIYPAWSPDSVQYAVDYKVLHEDILYKCISAHTSQADWAPGIAPSLWTAVETGEHTGTLEDPIPVPDSVTTSGFEYEYGKHYSEGDVTYLCKRGGIPDEQAEAMYGQKVTLYFPPSTLVGQYFSVAE